MCNVYLESAVVIAVTEGVASVVDKFSHKANLMHVKDVAVKAGLLYLFHTDFYLLYLL